MSRSEHDKRIDYIELPASDLSAIKTFYAKVFGWSFTDYGPAYTAFADGRLDGGFFLQSEAAPRGALVVIYAADLESLASAIVDAGGEISKAPFDFPGGRRFHFKDPSGNELAVWSES